MATLIWDEGMSVGIDAIDNEHKQIIAILAKLTSAENGDLSKEEAEEVFTELELYVSKHFDREEALLEKISYAKLEEHKESHQAFIAKVSKLKQQWLTQDSLTGTESITHFLHHWIVEHILEEDLDYVSAIKRYQQSSSNDDATHMPSHTPKYKQKQGCFEKVSTLFSQKVKLSNRVFITTFFPVLAFFIFYFITLFDNYRDYKNMSLVLGINQMIEHVDNISHSLQAERGLSSGFTSSNFQSFSKQLATRRLITDQAILEFQQFLQTGLDPVVHSNLQTFVVNSQNNFELLKQYRAKVDNKNADFRQTFQMYSMFVEQLLSVLEHLNHIDMESQLANNITAISSMLLFKEYMGQIRALGMNAIIDINEDLTKQQHITLVMGKQLNALRVFHYSASAEQKQLCANYCNAQRHQQLLNQHLWQVQQLYPINQPDKYWFDLMSREINQLKQVSDKLMMSFTQKLQAKNQGLAQSFYITFAILSVFLFAAVFFSLLLNYSIIKPIRRVTYALNDMAKGVNKVQFTTQVSHDEIGDMQNAFEKLRRKLLQMNVFQATVDRQKNEIEYRKSQQAHFENLATKDALTGAINRHRFDAVLVDEIERANRYEQPLSIMLLDIDFFKQVNDNFGHGVGDEVLVMFYRACKAAVRNSDVVARIGGEEFVIILPSTQLQNAYQFAERLREKIQQLEMLVDDQLIELTVSIGVSQWHKEHFSNVKEFVDDADQLLYQAKKQGRNKVVIKS